MLRSEGKEARAAVGLVVGWSCTIVHIGNQKSENGIPVTVTCFVLAPHILNRSQVGKPVPITRWQRSGPRVRGVM